MEHPIDGLSETEAYTLFSQIVIPRPVAWVLTDNGTAILVSTHDLALVRSRFPRCLTVNRSVLGDGDPATELTGDRLERLFSRSNGNTSGHDR